MWGLVASCSKLENIICVYLPDDSSPKHSGPSTQKQWIGGKNSFSFSVMGSYYKKCTQTFRDDGFASTLHIFKSPLSTHFKCQPGFSYRLSISTSVHTDDLLARC